MRDFDLDGLLLDTGSDITESVQFAAKKLNYPEQLEELLLSFISWGGWEENICSVFDVTMSQSVDGKVFFSCTTSRGRGARPVNCWKGSAQPAHSFRVTATIREKDTALLYIPVSVTSIESGALEGNSGFTVFAATGSYAELYSIEKKFNFVPVN